MSYSHKMIPRFSAGRVLLASVALAMAVSGHRFVAERRARGKPLTDVYCGPRAVKRVLEFYGRDVDLYDLVRAISAEGTTDGASLGQLKLLLEGNGLYAIAMKAHFDVLERWHGQAIIHFPPSATWPIGHFASTRLDAQTGTFETCFGIGKRLRITRSHISALRPDAVLLVSRDIRMIDNAGRVFGLTDAARPGADDALLSVRGGQCSFCWRNDNTQEFSCGTQYEASTCLEITCDPNMEGSCSDETYIESLATSVTRTMCDTGIGSYKNLTTSVVCNEQGACEPTCDPFVGDMGMCQDDPDSLVPASYDYNVKPDPDPDSGCAITRIDKPLAQRQLSLIAAINGVSLP